MPPTIALLPTTPPRRAAVLAAWAAIGWLACAGPRERGTETAAVGLATPGRHPIIILDVDTLRADHLGCYGYERDTSPHIDAFARESVLFEWAFGPAPNTLPSQTTILSSLYPGTHGAIADDSRVPQAVTTLAEVFAAAGYRTAAFADGGFMSRMFGHDQGFEIYDSARGGLARSGPRILEWVREHAREDFLLLVHTYDVHAPYDPPEPFRSAFLDGLEPPTPGFEPTIEELVRVRKSMFTDSPSPLPANDLAFTVARYDGGIRYVDDWIGGFLAELDGLGLLERATVVLLSDHGEEFQEHGSVGHEKIYSTITRIPLVIRPPGGVAARRIDEIVSAVDVMPTLIELAGLTNPAAVQGRSLVPLMRGEDRGPHLAFGESEFFGRRRFIAAEDYRLLYTEQSGKVELFRFRDDPHELEDLAAEKADSVVPRLRNGLLNWRAQVEAASVDGADGEIVLDAQIREQLEALGYLQ